MSSETPFIRRHAVSFVAFFVVGAFYYLTRLPEISRAELADLSSRFQFQRHDLAELSGSQHKFVRQVNPGFEEISGWISSVGAAVALNDLDGDGLPNDICHVDPRVDRVTVSPVPGTPSRYPAFELESTFLDRSRMAPMGCLPADLNEDGLMDLMVYYWGRTPLVFLRRSASATANSKLSAGDYVPRELTNGGERWYTNAATVADVDGDGHLDLIVGNYFPDGARVLDTSSTEKQQMQHSMSRATNGGGDRFFRWKSSSRGNEPDVAFELVQPIIVSDKDRKISGGWTLALGAADLDGDLLPEIYIANDFGSDHLLHNRSRPGSVSFAVVEGIKSFFTPNSKVLGRDSFKGMGVDFGDLNGDGLLDIYVSNIAAEYALEESHQVFLSTGNVKQLWNGIAPYVDASESLGLSRSSWGWDVKLADFDNDGTLEALQATGFMKGSVNRWPELHELAMANDQLIDNPRSWPRLKPGDDLSGQGHFAFFVRARNNRYYDLASEIGIAQPTLGRGIATADVDGDERLDFAIANQWDKSSFFLNKSVGTGAFLGLRLRLPVDANESRATTTQTEVTSVPSSAAIGSAVTVRLPNGKQLVAQIEGGNGHSGKRSSDLSFGLGALPAGESVNVEIKWRDRAGSVHETSLKLSAGWHTVMLVDDEKEKR